MALGGSSDISGIGHIHASNPEAFPPGQAIEIADELLLWP
jgi:hypothetical protein